LSSLYQLAEGAGRKQLSLFLYKVFTIWRYRTMLAEKKRMNLADIEAQSAFELPDREMMLIFVVINDVLNPDIDVRIPVKNNNIAVQICAAVELLDVDLLTSDLVCTIQQTQ